MSVTLTLNTHFWIPKLISFSTLTVRSYKHDEHTHYTLHRFTTTKIFFWQNDLSDTSVFFMILYNIHQWPGHFCIVLLLSQISKVLLITSVRIWPKVFGYLIIIQLNKFFNQYAVTTLHWNVPNNLRPGCVINSILSS